MSILPCPNPHGMLRVGRCGLNNPYGFWLFWLFRSLFLMVIKPLLNAGFFDFGRECTFCLVLEYCVYICIMNRLKKSHSVDFNYGHE